MTFDIPDPGAPSGTFAALERTSPIVEQTNGVVTTTSMRIANGTRVQHKNVLELIRSNRADFEEFGGVAFQTRPFETTGGTQQREVAILNEEHATLLLTYMRNSEIVRDFKKRLVRAFSELRRGEVVDLSDPIAAIEAANARSQAAIEIAKQERAARVEAESRALELAAPASAYREMVEAKGDYSVADAAKALTRDPKIDIKERALFAYMAGLGWVFKRDGRWKAYRTQLDRGRLAEKLGRPFWHAGREEMVNGEPTVRVTPKGLAELHRRLGGSSQLELMAVV